MIQMILLLLMLQSTLNGFASCASPNEEDSESTTLGQQADGPSLNTSGFGFPNASSERKGKSLTLSLVNKNVLSEVTVKSDQLAVSSRNSSRGRMHIGDDGIPVIEGVRRPDDESDKVVYRNAKVINGRLVPKKTKQGRILNFPSDSKEFYSQLAQPAPLTVNQIPLDHKLLHQGQSLYSERQQGPFATANNQFAAPNFYPHQTGSSANAGSFPQGNYLPPYSGVPLYEDNYPPKTEIGSFSSLPPNRKSGYQNVGPAYGTYLQSSYSVPNYGIEAIPDYEEAEDHDNFLTRLYNGVLKGNGALKDAVNPVVAAGKRVTDSLGKVFTNPKDITRQDVVAPAVLGSSLALAAVGLSSLAAAAITTGGFKNMTLPNFRNISLNRFPSQLLLPFRLNVIKKRSLDNFEDANEQIINAIAKDENESQFLKMFNRIVYRISCPPQIACRMISLLPESLTRTVDEEMPAILKRLNISLHNYLIVREIIDDASKSNQCSLITCNSSGHWFRRNLRRKKLVKIPNHYDK